MLQVTVVPTFTMMFCGHVTVAFGTPCEASCLSMATSATSPGTCTEPGLSSYVNLFGPTWVTVALPVAPLLKVTLQVNVLPAFAWTSLGHLALVTFADPVERLSLMPCSTWASSTVAAGVGVAVFAVASVESLPPQPELARARASAPKAAAAGVFAMTRSCAVRTLLTTRRACVRPGCGTLNPRAFRFAGIRITG